MYGYEYFSRLYTMFCRDDSRSAALTELESTLRETLLTDEQKQLLIALTDAFSNLLEATALRAFVHGFHLCCGIAFELNKDGRFVFFDDEERRARESYEQ